jgi:hypothetical protein
MRPALLTDPPTPVALSVVRGRTIVVRGTLQQDTPRKTFVRLTLHFLVVEVSTDSAAGNDQDDKEDLPSSSRRFFGGSQLADGLTGRFILSVGGIGVHVGFATRTVGLFVVSQAEVEKFVPSIIVSAVAAVALGSGEASVGVGEFETSHVVENGRAVVSHLGAVLVGIDLELDVRAITGASRTNKVHSLLFLEFAASVLSLEFATLSQLHQVVVVVLQVITLVLHVGFGEGVQANDVVSISTLAS